MKISKGTDCGSDLGYSQIYERFLCFRDGFTACLLLHEQIQTRKHMKSHTPEKRLLASLSVVCGVATVSLVDITSSSLVPGAAVSLNSDF